MCHLSNMGVCYKDLRGAWQLLVWRGNLSMQVPDWTRGALVPHVKSCSQQKELARAHYWRSADSKAQHCANVQTS